MNRAELVVRRRLVKAFIDADPVDIVLTRTSKVATRGAGFKQGTPRDLDPLRGRIVPTKRRWTDPFVVIQPGDVIRYPFLFFCRFDADIEKNDEFEWNGEYFVIVSIDPKREERIQAGIDYLGKENNDAR